MMAKKKAVVEDHSEEFEEVGKRQKQAHEESDTIASYLTNLEDAAKRLNDLTRRAPEGFAISVNTNGLNQIEIKIAATITVGNEADNKE